MDYLRLAEQEAGIDPTRWLPHKGLDANRATVEAVYAWYQRLFDGNPRLQWAGMAKLAGATVVGGLDLLDSLIHFGGLPVAALLGDLLNDLHADELGWLQVHFLQMQRAIFVDLAPMHVAFEHDGLAGVQKVPRPLTLQQAWSDIVSADPPRVTAGNTALLRREQCEILPPLYQQIGDHLDPVGQAACQLTSLITRSPMPGGVSFADFYGGWLAMSAQDKLVTNTSDRWAWISGDMLPKYQRLLANPAAAKTLIDMPLDQRAKEFDHLD